MTNQITIREAVTEQYPITVEVLTDSEDWQLRKLENGYLAEIGEEILTEEKQESLSLAIADGKITFFLAKRGCRAVGMCSVVTAFSTFACAEVGTFEDFYVEPAFRKQGIARKLAAAAQQWAKELPVLLLPALPAMKGCIRHWDFLFIWGIPMHI
ncbi:MAG: GNAT family N-acetyltransferase [Erysipelotrichaceae bacterium]|nr:GNAT family N-acetyltransferase [Erysipelotrichaceae bacterium]